MKKVLFLIHTLGAGGAEKVLINLVNNLDQSKYDITLMTVIDTGIFKQDIAKGIKYKTIFKLPHGNAKKSGEKSGSLHENYSCIKAIMKKTYTVFWRYANCAKIYKHFVKEKYDYEIAFLEGICAKIIASSNNDKSIKYSWVHVDLLNERKSESFFKNLDEEKKIYGQFNKIVCVSNVVKNSVKQKLGIKEQKLETLYNIIDSKEISNKSLDRIELEKDCLTFVSVGRLSNQKGCLQAIATQECVRKLMNSDEVYLIDYVNEYEARQKSWQFIFKGTIKEIAATMIKRVLFRNEFYKKRAFNEFICNEKVIPFDSVDKCSVLISGSDQIWNGKISHGIDRHFLLDFGNAIRKISIASSMGGYIISKQEKNVFRELLSKYDYISVREKFTKNQIEGIVDKNIYTILDKVTFSKLRTFIFS